jgi:hypothetical protein
LDLIGSLLAEHEISYMYPRWSFGIHTDVWVGEGVKRVAMLVSVPYLRPLVVGFSPQRPCFSPGVAHM